MKILITFAIFLMISILEGCSPKLFRGYLQGGKQNSSTDDASFRGKFDAARKHSRRYQVFYFPVITNSYPFELTSLVYYSRHVSLINSETTDNQLFYPTDLNISQLKSQNISESSIAANFKATFDNITTYSFSSIQSLANQINTSLNDSKDGWHSVRIETQFLFDWVFAYNLTLLNKLHYTKNVELCSEYSEDTKLYTLSYYLFKK